MKELNLYISVVPFPGPGLADSIPPDWSSAQKVTFLGVQFRDCFLGASEGSRGGFWSPFGWFWDLFFWSQTEGLCSLWKSVLSDCFLERRAKVFYCKTMQTVQYILKKSKVCFRWFRASSMCPKGVYFGVQKFVLAGSKRYPTPMFFGTWYKVAILGLLGFSWRLNLDLFWHARSGTRVPKIDFLKP